MADFHEGSSDTTDQSVTDATDPVAVKHYQVSVPNFAEVTAQGTAATSTTAERTSFLRLGSSFKDWSSAEATEDAAILYAEEASRKLAELVGSATAIASSENLATETATSAAGTYGGDPNYLLGFADDTRFRKADVDSSQDKTFIDGALVANAKATRQAETKKLLTKGGWWDHSDGNRITTTAGDKIEVIQGNYKMVVLGRQDPSNVNVANAFITDISGGIFQEQGPIPTPCIKTVEWRTDKNAAGELTLYQDNGSGNVITRYGLGDIEDRFEVRSKTTKIGLETQRTQISDTTWASTITGTVNATSISGVTRSSGDIQGETYATAGKIKSHTEAKDIESYTRVTGGMSEETHCGPTHSYKWTDNAGVREVFLGGHLGVFLGADLQAKLAAATNIMMGLTVNMALGWTVNFSAGVTTNISFGSKIERYAGGQYRIGAPVNAEVALTSTISALKVNLGMAPGPLSPAATFALQAMQIVAVFGGAMAGLGVAAAKT